MVTRVTCSAVVDEAKTELAEIVAEMRRLGVTHLERAGLVVHLGPEPIQAAAEETSNRVPTQRTKTPEQLANDERLARRRISLAATSQIVNSPGVDG